MRWNRPQEDNGTLSEVNLTPLIDVSLVLVVILLLATPLAFESSFGVRKTAESDSTVRVNRTLVAIEDLGDVLAALIAESSTRDVTVRCEGGVAHGTFVHVLDVTKLNGANEIAIAGS